jgi:methionyl-tRNA formyltransferase
MNIAFAGTPEFACAALAALHAAGHSVSLVLTQPDRPAGRGLKLLPSPVKAFATGHGLALAQPRSLRLDGKFPDDARAAQAALAQAAPELMVVAAYGLMLPPWVLALPRLGCLNIHASLLPRWRGAAPIHRAIEAGDDQTGITIMQMDAGLDTGPMLLTQAEAIHADDTTGSLHERLASVGAQLIVQALASAQAGTLAPQPQPAAGVSYAHKVDKAQARLDWSRHAAELERQVRAFSPTPGAWFMHGGAALKVWRARLLVDAHGAHGHLKQPGPGRIAVACGQGALELLELQAPGGKRQPADVFMRGHALLPGEVLAG